MGQINPSVSLKVVDDFAVVELHNAPVNALSKQVRQGLVEAVSQSIENDAVTAILISSQLPLFSAGADISEFSSGDLSPMLPEVLHLIETASKPVVALVNGGAFGGGLELALACHYRISFTKSKVGLPEVHLGILPGAGGTQRLPRLVNTQTALDMIVSGAPQPVEKLDGLFDLIIEHSDNAMTEVAAFVQSIKDEPIPRVSEIPLSLDAATEQVFTGTAEAVRKRARGFFAPNKCVEAVKSAFTLPFAQGLQAEAKLFMQCMETSQARAQQHFFFAERKAGSVDGLAKDTAKRDIKKVGIIGAGTMGGGIAMNFANVGIPVVMLEQQQEALDKGLAIIRKNYENTAKKGRLTTDQVEQRMASLSGSTDYADLSDVDLVIEAVFEKLDVKQTVFKKLDEVCKPGAILATNTSTLDVNKIAEVTSRPQDVIGLHFFSPANVMKLLEIVRAEKTSDEVIATSMSLAKKIKKVGVLVNVCFGFVGNRMIEVYGREANRLVLEGASPEQIDKVIYDFGLPMGPFTMGDMAGLDIGYFVRESRREFIAHDPSYCVLADQLVEQGRVGLKAGKGVFLYEQGSRTPIPDPTIIEMAEQKAKELGIERRKISEQEIIERCIYPLINEGAEILREGIAQRASDIDVIYVYGYGFPVFRGGPMQYADEVGLPHILDRLKHYQETLGDYGKAWFTPSGLLEQLVNESKTFSGMDVN